MDEPTNIAELRIAQALMNSAICCPAPGCGMHCRCIGYIEHSHATFECRACQRRYLVGLGVTVLRSESIAPVELAS